MLVEHDVVDGAADDDEKKAKKKKAADEAAEQAGSLAQDDTAAAGADTAGTAAGDSGTHFGVDETPRCVYVDSMRHHHPAPCLSYDPKQALMWAFVGSEYVAPSAW